jgi:hypothetical protein
MLLFRSEEHVDRWCQEKGLPRGAVFSLAQGWGLAKGWYSDRLSPDWRSKTTEEAEALFTELGLTGPFWRMG